jgi:beta-galactosidase GanA
MTIRGLDRIAYGGDHHAEQWPEEVWPEDVRLPALSLRRLSLSTPLAEE